MIAKSRIAVSTLLIFLATSLLFFGHTRIQDQLGSRKQEGPQTDDAGIDRYAEKSQYSASPSATEDCTQRPEWLQELAGSPDIKFPLKFARRDISVRAKPGLERTSVTKLDGQLLPEFQTIQSADSPNMAERSCLPPITLEVPLTPPHVDASHILFGAATTLDRLDASIPFIQRWLSNTGARLIVDVVGKDDRQADRKARTDLEVRMRGLGMLVTLVPPFEKKGNNVDRYLSLIRTLCEHRDDKTKWFAFIDDDTFFTSMSSLVSRLAEYDHHQRWYIGSVSEEWWTVCQYGWIAMGGGGIFLSPPLMEVLNANYADCKMRAKRTFGDHRLAQCIEFYTDTRLTQFDGLHQIDLHGDRSGVFESGRQVLSLHHWKEGYWSEDGSGADAIRHPRWFPLDTMSLVSDVCGDSCFLQRLQFGEDTLLSNGYSVAMYPKGHLGEVELFKMEKTWVTHATVEGSQNEGFDHYLGPLRPALKLESEKIQFRFMDAKVVKDGGVRQYFRHLGRDGKMDSLIELHWIREGGATNMSLS